VLLVVALSLAAAPALAQEPRGLDPRKAVTQLGLESWTTDHGLPNATVNTVLQTRDGYLWIGTHDGLARFDGRRFQVFDQAAGVGSNGVRALCEDRRGGLWIGTNGGGLAHLEGGVTTLLKRSKGLPSDAVWSLLADRRDGSVWVGTNGGGLARVRDGALQTFNPADSGRVINGMAQEADGTLWLAAQSEGLRRLSPDGRFTAFTSALHPSLSFVNSVSLTRDGTLWIAALGRGLVRMRAGRVEPLPPALEELASTSVTAPLEDREGTLWIGTSGKGLGRLAGGRLSLLGPGDGLGEVVYSLCEDREGSLWIGTNGAGLSQLHDGSFTAYGSREGLSRDFVYTSLQDQSGVIWAGTAGGLDRLENGRFVPVPAPVSQPVAVRGLAAEPGGALWVATYGAGLWRLEGGSWRVYTTRDGLASDTVRAALVDRTGRLWAATVAGLAVLEGGVWRTYGTADGLSRASLIGLAEDRDGRIWVGTDGGGVCRYRDGRFDAFTVREGLAGDLVLALFVDADGVLWVGTNGGLSRLSGDRFRSVTTRDGLPSAAVTQIQDDGNGSLWLGTSRGVVRVVKASLFRGARLEPETFDRADGLRSSQCTAPGQPAGMRGRDGLLWFATTRGLVAVNPAELRRDVQPPPIAIEEVLLDGQKVTGPAPLVVPPGKVRLELRFAALSFRAPSRTSVRFRLDGFDPDWLDAGDRRHAEYTGLPSGDYVFRVSARTATGTWGARDAELALRVQPRFYQTGAFAVGAVLVALGLVAGGHRLRVARLHSRERELTDVVARRTASLAEETARAETARARAERLLAATRAIGSTIDLADVLARILAELELVVPYDSASVQELRGVRLEIVGGRGFTNLAELLGQGFDTTAGDNPNGEVVRRREPLILDRASQRYESFRNGILAMEAGSWLGVPMLFGERVIGMLTLDKKEPGFYTDDHARLALSFAAQAAIALENARLYDAARRELAERRKAEEELRRQSTYLASLHETALALMDRLELDTLLEMLVVRAAHLLGAPDGFLYLETPDATRLECRVWIGSRPRDQYAGPGEGAVGHAWMSGQPVAIDDYDSWPHRSPQVPAGTFGAMLAVPLRFDEHVGGALGLAQDAGGTRRYGEAEVELLASFGQLASIALDNARLYGAACDELLERTRAQEALQKSEAQYRDLFEQSLGLICTHQLDGTLLSVNPAAAASLGRSAEEMVGRKLQDFMPGEVRDRFGAYLRTISAERTASGALVILTAQGQARTWRYRNILRETPGGDAYVIGFAQDVTEEGTAQRALQESELRFRQLAENIDAVFFMRAVDPPRILYVSPAYERIWGRSRESLYADPAELLETLHPEDRAKLADHLTRSEGYDLEYRIVRPDGGLRYVRTRAFPVRGRDGRSERMAGIAEDVTSRKAVEELRENLTNTVVHDLKNPLAALLGSVEVLLGDPGLSALQRSTLQIGERNGRRMLSMVDAILDVSRLEVGAMPVEPEPVDLAALIGELLDLQRPLADQRRLVLRFEAAPALPAAWADRSLTSRVLQNLVGNAIKFTPREGEVRVTTALDDAGALLRVSVSDTGPGIPEEMRGRLFQKFAAGRLAGRGSGLGLSFCRLAVEAQGGSIDAEERSGAGTTFVFTLPVVPMPGDPTSSATP